MVARVRVVGKVNIIEDVYRALKSNRFCLYLQIIRQQTFTNDNKRDSSLVPKANRKFALGNKPPVPHGKRKTAKKNRARKISEANIGPDGN